MFDVFELRSQHSVGFLLVPLLTPEYKERNRGNHDDAADDHPEAYTRGICIIDKAQPRYQEQDGEQSEDYSEADCCRMVGELQPSPMELAIFRVGESEVDVHHGSNSRPKNLRLCSFPQLSYGRTSLEGYCLKRYMRSWLRENRLPDRESWRLLQIASCQRARACRRVAGCAERK